MGFIRATPAANASALDRVVSADGTGSARTGSDGLSDAEVLRPVVVALGLSIGVPIVLIIVLMSFIWARPVDVVVTQERASSKTRSGGSPAINVSVARM
jgi:hypothetical protein